MWGAELSEENNPTPAGSWAGSAETARKASVLLLVVLPAMGLPNVSVSVCHKSGNSFAWN